MTFTDSKGKAWSFDVDIPSLRRLKDAGIDLANPSKPRRGEVMPIGHEIHVDDVVLVDAIRVLCKPAPSDGVFDPQTIAAARAALLEGLDGFFQPANRAVMAAYGRAVKEDTKTANSMFGKVSGKASTNSPESPESSPALA